jgi:hypothetical protein
MKTIFEVLFTILAIILLLNGEYEMSALAGILSTLARIEYKLEKNSEGGKAERILTRESK